MATVAGVPEAIHIEPVSDEAGLRQALALREVVFIEEQNVPESVEHDAEDATAFHVLAFDGGHAIGTGRLVQLPAAPGGESGKWGQVGRMAVLQSHRLKGLGRKILLALEVEARRLGLNGILLHAQVHAHEFYVRAGYADHGSQFDEAGLPHIQMRKSLTDAPAGAGVRKQGSSSSRGRSHPKLDRRGRSRGGRR
jgi:predicted GNAT family N-acyltransferase